MRIFLVDPPMQSIMQARADWYPMSLAYLAGSAVREGHECLIYNGEFDHRLDYVNLMTYSSNYHMYLEALKDPSHEAWKRISAVMRKFKPDVVGITSFSVKIPSALRIAALVKDYDPGIPVIMGGQHATIMTCDVLADPNVDFVARGEGEQTFLQFLRELERDNRWPLVKGLSWKDGGKQVNNPDRPLQGDIDNLAPPSRESLYDVEHYEPHALGKLFASRGCPYRCNYCGTQNIWTSKLRLHSPERIIEEIQDAKKKFGCSYFTFFDDVFGIDRKHTMSLLKAMIAADLGIQWDCLTRANLVSDELLSTMRRAGCTKIDMGVESGSDRILLDTQKGVTVQQIVEGAKMIKKHGIFLYTFFMIGLPTETEEDARMTRELLLAMRPDWAGISIFTPIPGTGQWNRLRDQGKLPDQPDYAKFSHQSPHSNFAFSMTDRQAFPALAQDMLMFIQNYNGSWRNVIRRALTRGYHKNPKMLWYDIKKFATWKGLLKASHHSSHAKFYAKTALIERE